MTAVISNISEILNFLLDKVEKGVEYIPHGVLYTEQK